MVLGASADGYLLDPVIIFRGTTDSKKLKEERHSYAHNEKYKGTHVLWQRKAWIDATTEMLVIKKQILSSKIDLFMEKFIFDE